MWRLNLLSSNIRQHGNLFLQNPQATQFVEDFKLTTFLGKFCMNQKVTSDGWAENFEIWSNLSIKLVAFSGFPTNVNGGLSAVLSSWWFSQMGSQDAHFPRQQIANKWAMGWGWAPTSNNWWLFPDFVHRLSLEDLEIFWHKRHAIYGPSSYFTMYKGFIINQKTKHRWSSSAFPIPSKRCI